MTASIIFGGFYGFVAACASREIAGWFVDKESPHFWYIRIMLTGFILVAWFGYLALST